MSRDEVKFREADEELQDINRIMRIAKDVLKHNEPSEGTRKWLRNLEGRFGGVEKKVQDIITYEIKELNTNIDHKYQMHLKDIEIILSKFKDRIFEKADEKYAKKECEEKIDEVEKTVKALKEKKADNTYAWLKYAITAFVTLIAAKLLN